MHSTHSKIKLFIYLFEAFMVMDWSAGIVVFGWSMVSLLLLQHSAALYPCFLQLWHFPMNFPYVISNSIDAYQHIPYYIGIKIGYFYLLFWA